MAVAAAHPIVWRPRAESLQRVRALVVPAPPCFGLDADAQERWVEWLAHALESGEPEVNPLVCGEVGPDGERRRVAPRFNKQLNFCLDCYGPGRVQAKREGRCRPDWIEQFPCKPLPNPLKKQPVPA